MSSAFQLPSDIMNLIHDDDMIFEDDNSFNLTDYIPNDDIRPDELDHQLYINDFNEALLGDQPEDVNLVIHFNYTLKSLI